MALIYGSSDRTVPTIWDFRKDVSRHQNISLQKIHAQTLGVDYPGARSLINRLL